MTVPLGTVMPSPEFYGWDANGDPLSGGLLYTYYAGTTTPAPTWPTSTLTPGGENTNPVVLNSAGFAPVFLAQETSYKFTLKSSTGTIMWTVDGIGSTGITSPITGLNGIAYVFGGSEFSPITATSYPAGATYDKCHADTAWWVIDSARLTGTFQLQGMLIGTGITDSVSAAFVNLTDGAPNTAIVEITATNGLGTLVTSSDITFAVPGSAKTYAIKTKVTSGSGFAFGLSIVRTA